MRLLLDENLPRKLKREFLDHEIFTVREKGWNGISNGELLRLMLEDDFDALITFDKNLQHQQNFERYPIAVMVLTADSNQYKNLQPLAEKVRTVLKTLVVGVHIVV